MPRIPYRAANFPESFTGTNGNGVLVLPWAALLWAAITVGRRELLHVTRHGEFSTFEIAYRAAIVFANLCDDGAGLVRRSLAYDGLDPSEKSAISYFLGMTVAKAFVEQRLGVPWLMHLDVYREELQAIAGRSRPDLVGRTSGGEWVAIEAKGRTNGFDSRALVAAKAQARRLESVAGQLPVVRAGMVTHFSDSRLQFDADDPPVHRKSRERVVLPLDRERLIEAYYRPFRTWLARASVAEIEGVKYRATRVDAADLTVGLRIDLLARDPVDGASDTAELKTNIETLHIPGAPTRAQSYVGPDGVVIIPGPLWSDENMTREPQERTAR